MPILPQDIISLILEQHLFNDIFSLRACSLVSRSFLAPSQKRLFHTIHLDDDLKAQEHCRKLHQVFLDNPYLVTYVQEMYVLDYDTDTVGPTPWKPYTPSRVIHWASREETLHAILKMLLNLRLFSIRFIQNCSSPTEWKSISVELKMALGSVFTLPTLKVCKLDGIDDLPVEYFSASEYLKELSLTAVSVARDQEALATCSKTAQLECLELAQISDYSLFETMRASMDMSQLREVFVCSSDPQVVWEAIKESTGTLEILMWNDDGGDSGHTLLWLVQSLREMVSGVGDGISNLEEISIHLDLGAIQSGIEVSLWNELDRLLTHSGKFSKLHRVYLCVSSPIGRRVSIEELFSRNYVPGLSRKGLLRMGYNTVWLEYPIEWREAAVGHD
ncbi:hypothetical protein L208DRAFT_1377225 [Tricholoma matsutake]|nr:hypothetical protein L208DRAFT_1377225 [Tricholoma matsutake 945]